jgi:ParB family chromosome partitioning protein
MSAKRSALGRGLGALIPNQGQGSRTSPQANPPSPTGRDEASGASSPSIPSASAAAEVFPQRLPVAKIDPNPDQPRRVFDPAELQKLAQSILRHGVLQPIVVRRLGDRYQLVVGERRWRASRAAGLQDIPAVVADVDPDAQLELAIVENVQRHDLNPMELAVAYRALADQGHTQEEIGQKVSMDRSSVANHLRLLELSRELQEDVELGRLSMGHAKALLQVTNPERRRHVRDRIVEDALSVRAAEKLARETAGPSARRKRPKAPSPSTGPGDLDSQHLLELLSRRYQARVSIRDEGGKGRIEIEFSGSEDLDRITSLLLGEA